jgi:hypothetical protein
MTRQTTAHVKGKSGEMVVQDNHTDAPLLPIQSIEKLNNIRPDRVDWVFEQTEIEAKFRRDSADLVNREATRTNTFVFVERVIGQLCAFLLGLAGICGGIYAGITGHEWLGGVIATAAIATLASNFLRKKSE